MMTETASAPAPLPTVLDPTVLDPTVLDPTVLDPTVLDPTVLDPSALALTHLQRLLETGELDAQAAQESASEENLTLAITGPDAALLVGQHGQSLDALQFLLMLMTNKGPGPRLRITVDADGYRARRMQKLIGFAEDLAVQATKSGQEAITDVLSPMERRIIHTALADNPDVETYSEGDEPNRYVVITPRLSEGAAS